MKSVARIRFYKKSGARLYLPERLVRDARFPFKDEDLVKIEIGNDSLIIEKPEWWEMLNWNEMRSAFKVLPNEIKQKILEQGLAPR